MSKKAIADEMMSQNNPNEYNNQMVKADVKVFPKVKCIYSSQLKKKVKDILKENSLMQAHLLCDRRIPKSTLHGWKKGKIKTSEQ